MSPCGSLHDLLGKEAPLSHRSSLRLRAQHARPCTALLIADRVAAGRDLAAADSTATIPNCAISTPCDTNSYYCPTGSRCRDSPWPSCAGQVGSKHYMAIACVEGKKGGGGGVAQFPIDETGRGGQPGVRVAMPSEHARSTPGSQQRGAGACEARLSAKLMNRLVEGRDGFEAARFFKGWQLAGAGGRLVPVLAWVLLKPIRVALPLICATPCAWYNLFTPYHPMQPTHAMHSARQCRSHPSLLLVPPSTTSLLVMTRLVHPPSPAATAPKPAPPTLTASGASQATPAAQRPPMVVAGGRARSAPHTR